MKGNKIMENFKTSKFTAKDMFNSTSATSIKDVEGKEIKVVAVAIKNRADGEEQAGLLKAEDGTIYVTTSVTIMEQLLALREMVEEGSQTVKIVGRTSNNNRTYYLLELV